MSWTRPLVLFGRTRSLGTNDVVATAACTSAVRTGRSEPYTQAEIPQPGPAEVATMCCLVATLFMLGPRAAILVWWLLQPVRWEAAFDTFIWPFAGFLVAPWTTLMYVAVAPAGITGFDYLWLGIAVAMDLISWFGGGYSNRSRMPTYGA